MTTARVFAPAKVNLALHITGQRGDGYHLLDSLVVFPKIGDVVTATPAETLSLSVAGPMAAGIPTDRGNLMVQAAEWLGAGRGATLTLEKNLPHPAGIGGGSADAASAIKALCSVWDMPVPLPSDTIDLGADVPVCIAAPIAQRVHGIGDVLTPVTGLPAHFIVLANPGLACPTPSVFAALACKENRPIAAIPNFKSFDAFAAWLADQRNDLELPAIEIVPKIDDVLRALRQDAALARISGSGATCFGLYETKAQADAAVARLSATGWWVQAGAVS